MSRSPVSPKPLTGRKVLFMLVAFFGVVFGVNFLMAKLAIDTLPGTEVDSAYSASLAYEKEIAAARDQNARNWKVDAHVQRGAGWRRHAAGRGARQQRQADVRPEVSGPLRTAYRPARRSAGRRLRRSAAASIAAARPLIAPGQWDLVLEGDAAGQRMFLSKNRVLLN